MKYSGMDSGTSVTNGIILFLIALSVHQCLVVAQYETANNLCGGFFRFKRGSINFRFNNESVGHVNKICVWTIIPPVPFEHESYSMSVSAFYFPATAARLSVNGFKERTTNPQTLFVTGASEKRFEMNGPLVVIVLKVPTAVLNQGFDMHWQESGAQLNVSRLTNTYHSWSRASSIPPYFAANYMRNEISTFALPKGNHTEGYVLQMIFNKIRLDVHCSPLPTNPSRRISCDFIDVHKIEESGALTPTWQYTINSTNEDAMQSRYGLYMIIWLSDTPRGGGSFEMMYSHVKA